MRKASTALLEQGTQTPSPAPDLIPAETKKSTEDAHTDWYSKRGHFTSAGILSGRAMFRQLRVKPLQRTCGSAWQIDNQNRKIGPAKTSP